MSLGGKIGVRRSDRAVLILLVVLLPALRYVPLVRRFCESGHLVSTAISPANVRDTASVRAGYLYGVVHSMEFAESLSPLMETLYLPLFFAFEPWLSPC